MTKPKRQRVIEESQADLAGVLERLKDLEGTDPYIADAVGFLTQAGVCLGKQLETEFPDLKPPPEKPQPAKPTRMEKAKAK